MSGTRGLDRRGFLARGLGGGGHHAARRLRRSLRPAWVVRILDSAETLTRVTQRAILSPRALAREYSEAEISRDFKANGSTESRRADYKAHVANGFADWQLKVGGLVERPLELSLADLRAMPSRTQITRHDCVEGWSCIGKWKGVPLSALLETAKLKPDARYIVFYCADDLGGTGTEAGKYYETIELVDAFHPQTILAYEMNDQTLPVPAWGAACGCASSGSSATRWRST